MIMSQNDQKVIDYDLHNIVGIRVINATSGDVNVVSKQIGLPLITLTRQPDIIIRFEKELNTASMKLLGINSCGFTDQGFYMLKGKRRPAKALIPFDQIGGQCEIVCQSGLREVPLLGHIINFTLIKKEFIPVHASSFKYKGEGILVAGWKTGGKTEALLSFIKNGAGYIGDEWIILSPDGKRMFGIPMQTSIKDWQFEYIPNLLPKISWQNKIMFETIHFLDWMYKKFEKLGFHDIFPIRILGDVLPAFKRQLKIWVNPQEFFGDQYFGKSDIPQKIFLIMLHNRSDIIIERCSTEEVAERLVHANISEQGYFFEFYTAYKFAFRNRKNEFIENLEQRQMELLRSALASLDAYKIYRPHPVSLDLLFKKMQPFCDNKVNEIMIN